MSQILDNYFVTFHMRPAELAAIENLPDVTKERVAFFPQLAPRSKQDDLFSSLRRLGRVIGNREYFLGLDKDFLPRSSRPRSGWVREQEGDSGAELHSQSEEEWLKLTEKPIDIELWEKIILFSENINPVSPLARLLHAWDRECSRMHRTCTEGRWPTLAEQLRFLGPDL